MGSTLKFDSDRRGLARERRQARQQRNQIRRQARRNKSAPTVTLTPTSAPPPVITARQTLASMEITAPTDTPAPASPTPPAPALTPSANVTPAAAVERDERDANGPCGVVASSDQRAVDPRPSSDATRVQSWVSRREREIAAFEQRRRQMLEIAGEEAGRRLARNGGPASVADALAALHTAQADPWRAQYEPVDRALRRGLTGQVAATARRAMWQTSRDAARTSKRAQHRPRPRARGLCRVRDPRHGPGHRDRQHATHHLPRPRQDPRRVLALSPSDHQPDPIGASTHARPDHHHHDPFQQPGRLKPPPRGVRVIRAFPDVLYLRKGEQ
jgi:hypothetical protein